jgi:hypothetical protein
LTLSTPLKERLAFWWKFPSKGIFHYDPDKGEGSFAESYDPFKDEMRMRYSQFGYVTGHGNITLAGYRIYVEPIPKYKD